MLKCYNSVVCQRLTLQKREAKILLLQQTNQYFIDTMNTYKKKAFKPLLPSPHTNTASLTGGVNTGPSSDQWNAQKSYYLSLREIFLKNKDRFSWQGTFAFIPPLPCDWNTEERAGNTPGREKHEQSWWERETRAPLRNSPPARHLLQDFLLRATGKFLTVKAIIVGV